MPKLTTVRAMRPLFLVPVALVLAAGCSSGGSSSSSSSLTPQQMASKIGCTFQPNTGATELFVSQEGDCTVDGHDVTLYTFDTTGALNNWMTAAKGFGLGPHVTGKLWIASVDDAGVASKVQSKLGGKVG